MKFFVDFEFNEYRDSKEHSILDVISVGMASEDGWTLYLQSCEFDLKKCSQWVKDNVFPGLNHCPYKGSYDMATMLRQHKDGQCLDQGHGFLHRCPWRDHSYLRYQIQTFIGDKKPEWITWCGSHDFFLLCQIFGGMLSLPVGWPHSIIDIQRDLDSHDISDCALPPQESRIHNALDDALYIKELWGWLHPEEPL